MTIDILSDLHFDYFFKRFNNSKKDIQKIFDEYFLKSDGGVGDVLVVAGDIGHYNNQNIIILKMIKKIYGYRHIICVLGNHDYFLQGKQEQANYGKNSFIRAQEMRELINTEEGMHCLNGTVVEIDGVKFGGADSSYSSAYLKHYHPLSDAFKANNAMWKQTMPDANMIFGIKNYDDLYSIELPKIEAVYRECDVMITHVNPSYLHEHLSPLFYNQHGNMFFSFDGHKYLKEGTMKYWIFGHTHEKTEYEFEGVQCICNPLGSPNERYSGDAAAVRRIYIKGSKAEN